MTSFVHSNPPKNNKTSGNRCGKHILTWKKGGSISYKVGEIKHVRSAKQGCNVPQWRYYMSVGHEGVPDWYNAKLFSFSLWTWGNHPAYASAHTQEKILLLEPAVCWSFKGEDLVTMCDVRTELRNNPCKKPCSFLLHLIASISKRGKKHYCMATQLCWRRSWKKKKKIFRGIRKKKSVSQENEGLSLASQIKVNTRKVQSFSTIFFPPPFFFLLPFDTLRCNVVVNFSIIL